VHPLGTTPRWARDGAATILRSRRIRSIAWLAVVCGIALSYAATYAAGGTRSGFSQLFYLPIFAAAAVYGPLSGVVTAAASGIVCLLIPFDVAANVGQDTRSWAVRLIFFVLAGAFIGALSFSLVSRVSRLKRQNEQVVTAFERAIDAMHHYTAEHSASVAQCAVATARQLQLDEAAIARLQGQRCCTTWANWRYPSRCSTNPAHSAPTSGPGCTTTWKHR